MLSINREFPVLTHPPQHNRGDRTVTYRSERICARFVPSPKRVNADFEDRSTETLARIPPQKPRTSKLHLGVPCAIALTVGTVSIEQQPLDLFVSPLESNSRLEAANLKTFASTRSTAGLHHHHYVGALGVYTASACARLEVLG